MINTDLIKKVFFLKKINKNLDVHTRLHPNFTIIIIVINVFIVEIVVTDKIYHSSIKIIYAELIKQMVEKYLKEKKRNMTQPLMGKKTLAHKS